MRTRYIELGAGPGLFIALFQLPIVILVLAHLFGDVVYSVAMSASIAGLELATGILSWFCDDPKFLKLPWTCLSFFFFVHYFAMAIELS